MSQGTIQSGAVMLAISGPPVDAYGKPNSNVGYEGYQEFLLDRIAANYVSFTILEDEDLEQYKANYHNDDDAESHQSSRLNDTSNPFTQGSKEIGHIDF